MREEKCRVAENLHVNEDYWLMKIEATYVSERARPGNFVMVAVSSTHDPLLKRPFGIFKAEPPFIWIYYQVKGKGTAMLADMKRDDRLNVLGPLGNSSPAVKDKHILFIAGGRGIAPLYYALGHYAAHNRMSLVYGAKSKGDLNLLDRIAALPLEETYLYTEDGSIGKRGVVSDDIRDIIKRQKIDTTLSCGPDAMFASLHREIGGMGIKNWVSLEALMGCGFGICYSCAVKAKEGGYKKVCSDGPVFLLEEIAW